MSKKLNDKLLPQSGYRYTIHHNKKEYKNITVTVQDNIKFTKEVSMELTDLPEYFDTKIVFNNDSDLTLEFKNPDHKFGEPYRFHLHYTVSGLNIYIDANNSSFSAITRSFTSLASATA